MSESVVSKQLSLLLEQYNLYWFDRGEIKFNPKGLWQINRQNTGAMRTESGGFIRFGFNGLADYGGVFTTGQNIGIECKADPKKKTTKEQDVYRDMLQLFGGLHYRIDTVEGAIKLVDGMLVRAKVFAEENPSWSVALASFLEFYNPKNKFAK